MRVIFLWLFLLLVGVPLPASLHAAVINTYTDLSSWQTAAGSSVTLFDFNSYTEDQIQPIDFGPFTYSATGAFASENGVEAYDPSPSDINRFDRNIDGTSYLSADLDNTIITLLFDDAITAFAWDYTSLAGGDEFLTVLGTPLTIPDVGDPPSDAFFGFVSDRAFTEITISGIDAAFGADNFRFTTTVPIPAAVYLFGSALGLLGWMRRKTV